MSSTFATSSSGTFATSFNVSQSHHRVSEIACLELRNYRCQMHHRLKLVQMHCSQITRILCLIRQLFEYVVLKLRTICRHWRNSSGVAASSWQLDPELVEEMYECLMSTMTKCKWKQYTLKLQLNRLEFYSFTAKYEKMPDLMKEITDFCNLTRAEGGTDY